MTKRLANRVLLIGWDAADWKMIRPLLDAGNMPTLAGLLATGTSGNLATLQPALSPMLWNSIATGKRADKHGICSFVEPLPDRTGIRPVTSTSRKCKALWNILTQAGLSSNVVSWFASHPAEPIRGAIISDHFASRSVEPGETLVFPDGTFHPRELEDEVGPLFVSKWQIEVDALLPFVPRAGEINQTEDDRLVKLASIIARTSTIQAAACRLAARDDWDFMAVYYSAIDEFGHYFMPYHPPQLRGVSEHDAAIYSDVMTGCYRFHDMMLEALLTFAGSETTVLLVSDHGFHNGKRRPSANAWHDPETWHREFGIACAQGPGIRRDETLFGATLLDVAPTILALLGLPIGDDMDGRAWLEIFEEPICIHRIESWESVPGDAGLHSEELREDPAGAAEIIRRLADLGYINSPSDDADEKVRLAIRDARINLAVAVTSSRRAADALKLWQQLAADHPDEDGLRFQLAACLLRLGRWSECYDAIESIRGELRQSPYVQLILASIAAGEARLGDALKLAREVALRPLDDPRLANRVGQLFLELESWDEADSAFRLSLAVLEENPVAIDGLAQVSLQRTHFETALEQALLAVGLMHFFPAAHFHLGEALTGMGRNTEAIAAYETSLAMGFEPKATHARLAHVYRLRNPAKARHHEYLACSP
jgi:predicted AlkP superfamily phosphohydrolase/phosphomutase/tetratricopeptide (TPR) repeat protein